MYFHPSDLVLQYASVSVSCATSLDARIWEECGGCVVVKGSKGTDIEGIELEGVLFIANRDIEGIVSLTWPLRPNAG